jgi:hypothetical protein
LNIATTWTILTHERFTLLNKNWKLQNLWTISYSMNDFVLNKQIREVNGFPSIWYTKRLSSLKQISEDFMNGILNLEHSFYINEIQLQKTVSSLNIATTWTNLTYERFTLLKKNWKLQNLWTISYFKQFSVLIMEFRWWTDFEPWTFLLHERNSTIKTVSLLNIPITWTNSTYERFPLLNKNFVLNKQIRGVNGIPSIW